MNNLKTMKRKCLYLFAFFAIAVVSCKKSKIAPVAEVDAPVVVVTEDANYLNVANTIVVSGVLEGAKFDWINESKKGVSIRIKYTEDGLTREKLLTNSVDAAGTVTVPIFGLTNFTVIVSNTNGKATDTKLMGVLPILKPEAKLSKVGWTASASSEINDADNEFNGALNIVDEVGVRSISSPDLPSFWQTNYNAEPMLNYPHWLLVDMKAAIRITKIGLNAHTDANQGFSSFKLEGSADGVTFSDIGAGVKIFDPAKKTEQTFAVSTPVAIRYVRITLLVGAPYPCLANFEAYARK